MTDGRLAAGTPVVVMMNEEISTMSSRLGQRFGVTVLHDVVDNDIVVIPKGTVGQGEVTFRTNKGAFGKPGIIAISLRSLDLAGKSVALDGRYREEGTNNHGATAATWFAVGIFAGFVTGKSGVIPKGRELKARTGEDIVFATAASPNANDLAVPTPIGASTIVAPAPPAAAVADTQQPTASQINIRPK